MNTLQYCLHSLFPTDGAEETLSKIGRCHRLEMISPESSEPLLNEVLIEISCCSEYEINKHFLIVVVLMLLIKKMFLNLLCNAVSLRKHYDLIALEFNLRVIFKWLLRVYKEHFAVVIVMPLPSIMKDQVKGYRT